MKCEKTMDGFSAVLLVILGLTNAVHLLWTAWLIMERWKPGWGGIKLDPAALWPWLAEFLSVPVLTMALVYGVMVWLLRYRKNRRMIALVLVLLLLLQIILTNLVIL